MSGAMRRAIGLAVRSLEGLPLSFPGTTGVKAPVRGGRLFRAQH